MFQDPALNIIGALLSIIAISFTAATLTILICALLDRLYRRHG